MQSSRSHFIECPGLTSPFLLIFTSVRRVSRPYPIGLLCGVRFGICFGAYFNGAVAHYELLAVMASAHRRKACLHKYESLGNIAVNFIGGLVTKCETSWERFGWFEGVCWSWCVHTVTPGPDLLPYLLHGPAFVLFSVIFLLMLHLLQWGDTGR